LRPAKVKIQERVVRVRRGIGPARCSQAEPFVYREAASLIVDIVGRQDRSLQVRTAFIQNFLGPLAGSGAIAEGWEGRLPSAPDLARNSVPIKKFTHVSA